MALVPIFPDHECPWPRPVAIDLPCPASGVVRCEDCGRLFELNWSRAGSGSREITTWYWAASRRSLTYEDAVRILGPEPWGVRT